MFAVILIRGNFFLRIAGKIAKIRTRQNFAEPLYHARAGRGEGNFHVKVTGMLVGKLELNSYGRPMWLLLKLKLSFKNRTSQFFFVKFLNAPGDTWMGKYSEFPSQTPLVRPKSAIYTPKWDDEHPRNFYTGVPPTRHAGGVQLLNC